MDWPPLVQTKARPLGRQGDAARVLAAAACGASAAGRDARRAAPPPAAHALLWGLDCRGDCCRVRPEPVGRLGEQCGGQDVCRRGRAPAQRRVFERWLRPPGVDGAGQRQRAPVCERDGRLRLQLGQAMGAHAARVCGARRAARRRGAGAARHVRRHHRWSALRRQRPPCSRGVFAQAARGARPAHQGLPVRALWRLRRQLPAAAGGALLGLPPVRVGRRPAEVEEAAREQARRSAHVLRAVFVRRGVQPRRVQDRRHGLHQIEPRKLRRRPSPLRAARRARLHRRRARHHAPQEPPPCRRAVPAAPGARRARRGRADRKRRPRQGRGRGGQRAAGRAGGAADVQRRRRTLQASAAQRRPPRLQPARRLRHARLGRQARADPRERARRGAQLARV
mmetsp:Transcript_81264/g.243640  ORF Transcript_81264/g.243640 Transcript_81264/m.243640 type:complete len:395 (+) Transcript_81264:911-2095(+)